MAKTMVLWHDSVNGRVDILNATFKAHAAETISQLVMQELAALHPELAPAKCRVYFVMEVKEGLAYIHDDGTGNWISGLT